MVRSGFYTVSDPEADRSQQDSDGRNSSATQVLLTRMAGDGMDVTVHMQNKRKTPYRSALTRLLCCIYGMAIVVLGLVFAVANSLTQKERVHYYYLEVFMLYLYLFSLLFFIYIHCFLLRGIKTGSYEQNNIRVTLRHHDSINKPSSIPPSPREPRDDEKGDRVSDQDDKSTALREPSPCNDSIPCSLFELPVEGTVGHVGEGINFYLRLGAIAFSIGSVTLDGFHIASYFESQGTETCRSKAFILVYVLHLFFTFVQTFFIFKNHKLVINRHKAFVRLGLMHLLATNICVWINSTVTEATDTYRQKEVANGGVDNRLHISLIPLPSNGSSNGTMTAIYTPLSSCYADLTLARITSPYLFPCTIQYSLIAAAILYRMFSAVGIKYKRRWTSHTSLTSSGPASPASVDCEKANKGLFLGLLIGTVTLVAIATFFVFEIRLLDKDTAIKIYYSLESTLLIITIIGAIFGYIRLAQLKFAESRDITLSGILLAIGLLGSYVYHGFVIISAGFGFMKYGLVGFFSLGCTGLALIQITIQAVFLFDSLRRCSETEEHIINKPGRATVTFLLLCNLALWAVYIFEVKKTSVVSLHEDFYGLLPWHVLTHLTLPLIIFYRFVSSVCLSDVWFLPYLKEKPY